MNLSEVVYVLRGLFFISFFSGAALAYVYRDRFHLRQLFVVTFVVCVLAVNMTSVGFAPLVDLHKFSGAGPTEKTDYELRLTDVDGKETLLDARATRPIPPSRLTLLGETLVENCNATEREAMAAYLLEEARSYRNSVEADPLVRSDRLRFPQHEYGYRWTKRGLSEYGNFTGLRIYELERRLTRDGSAIESASETLVYEFRASPGDERRRNAARKRHQCS